MTVYSRGLSFFIKKDEELLKFEFSPLNKRFRVYLQRILKQIGIWWFNDIAHNWINWVFYNWHFWNNYIYDLIFFCWYLVLNIFFNNSSNLNRYSKKIIKSEWKGCLNIYFSNFELVKPCFRLWHSYANLFFFANLHNKSQARGSLHKPSKIQIWKHPLVENNSFQSKIEAIE